jgi:hypothetical protein
MVIVWLVGKGETARLGSKWQDSQHAQHASRNTTLLMFMQVIPLNEHRVMRDSIHTGLLEAGIERWQRATGRRLPIPVYDQILLCTPELMQEVSRRTPTSTYCRIGWNSISYSHLFVGVQKSAKPCFISSLHDTSPKAYLNLCNPSNPTFSHVHSRQPAVLDESCISFTCDIC